MFSLSSTNIRLLNSRYFKKVKKIEILNGFPNLNSLVSIAGLLTFILLSAAYIEKLAGKLVYANVRISFDITAMAACFDFSAILILKEEVRKVCRNVLKFSLSLQLYFR